MESFRQLALSLDFGSRFVVLLVASVVIAEIVQRLLRLPRITGYVLGGVLFGPSVLAAITLAEVRPLGLLVELVLGLLVFELGSRVQIVWLRNNLWLLVASCGEALATFAAVMFLLRAWGVADNVALVVAAVCIATSPGVVVRIVNELRARGQVTERVLLMAVLNVIYSIVAFETVLRALRLESTTLLLPALLSLAYFLCGACLLGAIVAFLVNSIFGVLSGRDTDAFVLAFSIVLLAGAAAHQLRLSIPLALLLGGLMLRHYSTRLVLFPPHFGTAGEVLVVIMFVLTGIQLDVSMLYAGGLLALSLVAARAAAKMAIVAVLARPAGLGVRKGLLVGVALTPMSTLALLMISDPRLAALGLRSQGSGIVFASLFVMQLLGPVACALALRCAREERVDLVEKSRA